MRRRLFNIYKYQNGRSDSNRSDFAEWLAEVGDWIEEQGGEGGEDKGEEKAGEADKEGAKKEEKDADAEPAEEE